MKVLKAVGGQINNHLKTTYNNELRIVQDKTLIHFPNFNIGFSNVRISPAASQ